MVSIPKWHEFMRLLLEVLKENGEMYRHDAIDAVVQKVGLTEEQLAEKKSVMVEVLLRVE